MRIYIFDVYFYQLYILSVMTNKEDSVFFQLYRVSVKTVEYRMSSFLLLRSKWEKSRHMTDDCELSYLWPAKMRTPHRYIYIASARWVSVWRNFLVEVRLLMSAARNARRQRHMTISYPRLWHKRFCRLSLGIIWFLPFLVAAGQNANLPKIVSKISCLSDCRTSDLGPLVRTARSP